MCVSVSRISTKLASNFSCSSFRRPWARCGPSPSMSSRRCGGERGHLRIRGHDHFRVGSGELLKLPADPAIQRIRASAAQGDDEDHHSPQEGKLGTATWRSSEMESVRPVNTEGDDRQFNCNRSCCEARQETKDQQDCADRLAEILHR